MVYMDVWMLFAQFFIYFFYTQDESVVFFWLNKRNSWKISTSEWSTYCNIQCEYYLYNWANINMKCVTIFHLNMTKRIFISLIWKIIRNQFKFLLTDMNIISIKILAINFKCLFDFFLFLVNFQLLYKLTKPIKYL